MADEIKKITLPLTKAQVLANTAKSLPYNGSEANLPARTIWTKQWKGQENLYDLIASSATQIDDSNAEIWSAIDRHGERLDTDEANVATIYGYFSGSVANRATADAGGNIISEQYATKEEMQQVIDGAPFAYKTDMAAAQADIAEIKKELGSTMSAPNNWDSIEAKLIMESENSKGE